jgi:DNA-binding response OmpR family regulator
MAHVLLVDDDPGLLDVLSLAFGEAGHQVQAAADGEQGLRAHAQTPADLLVVDVNMPRVDGFTLTRRLRERGDRVPILLLTSRADEVDEAFGLGLGADDYVSKPFSTRVLLARVDALLRRTAARAQPAIDHEVLRLGALAVWPARLEVRLHEHVVDVTVTEFHLLHALLKRPGVVQSRATLLTACRGDESVVGDRLIDTYVRRLRRKLEAVDVNFAAIETVTGAGYRLRDGA